jgi:carbon-monoxide dehydrogenase medium subunit
LRPRVFDYYAPSTLDEALRLLQSKEDPKILAGGQSLLALMKFRLASPKSLIDINGLRELDYIREDSGKLVIGALTRHDQLEHHFLIKTKVPILSDAASVIADQQVRNRGTVGGSLAHADPTADLPPAMLAAGASVVAVGPNGSRTIPCGELFQSFFQTNLEPNEILREIHVPVPPAGSGSAYLKLSRRHGDFAIVGAAAMLTMGPDGTCKSASVVLGGVGPVPHRAVEVEKALMGKKGDEKLIESASQYADRGVKPPSDVHASSEYRLEMTKVMSKRALKKALERVKGGK